jgi:acetate kinase
MTNHIITCNAGSSNTKLALFDATTLARTANIQTHNDAETLAWLHSVGEHKSYPFEKVISQGRQGEMYDEIHESKPDVGKNLNQMGVSAIGHRVVHGGDKFIHPTLITPEILVELEKFTPLAPLHQPAALKLITEVTSLYPNIPQVACFDTAFHHSMPEIERRLPLPQSYFNDGIKRYGFHGLSYQYIASVLPERLGDKATGRIIVAHLGNGSSMCAMKNFKSMASTMGFSTLDGLMMGTRCGALDVGVILHLIEHKKMSIDDINKLLYKNSGLLGVSGVSSDMRELLASSANEARKAVELYCYLAAKQLASLIPAIGGIDALVFTGGIGEHAEPIRHKICSHLTWLGDFPIHIIPTNEESVIAKSCREVLF